MDRRRTFIYDRQPGRKILSIFPNIEGVLNPREGPLEAFFHERKNVPEQFTRLILGDNCDTEIEPKAKAARTETTSGCALQ